MKPKLHGQTDGQTDDLLSHQHSALASHSKKEQKR